MGSQVKKASAGGRQREVQILEQRAALYAVDESFHKRVAGPGFIAPVDKIQVEVQNLLWIDKDQWYTCNLRSIQRK
jgi:hypothetical protein